MAYERASAVLAAVAGLHYPLFVEHTCLFNRYKLARGCWVASRDAPSEASHRAVAVATGTSPLV